jgi:hypothetical protein
MSRSASGAVVRRALNRVLPAPPVLTRRSAALIGWRGPVAPDDDVPPPEAFPRLVPQHARPAEWILGEIARSERNPRP